MDIRAQDFLDKYQSTFSSLKQRGYNLEIIFLEANEEILLRRYSQTRRHHPLSKKKSLVESIHMEKNQLTDLKKAADIIIDTSSMNIHELKSEISTIAQKDHDIAQMQINVLSFGFKYGLPPNADLVIDVRFLKNPYFVPELKQMDGNCEDVKNYILNNEETQQFLQIYLNLLDYLIPLYQKEGKSYLTIAVGCTGGRHRSVVLSQSVFKHIQKHNLPVVITHRDIEKDINSN
jgi:UPF0042 nucleotide-binding protein